MSHRGRRLARVTRVPMGRLAEAIRRSWGNDTSVDPDLTGLCPSRGQCAVTALVVQDYLGGDLLRATVDGTSHYWNRLTNGEIVDLSREQFESFEPINVEQRAREYVLSFPETASRYHKLALRTRDHLTLEPAGDFIEI
jgi:hypothetical protein